MSKTIWCLGCVLTIAACSSAPGTGGDGGGGGGDLAGADFAGADFASIDLAGGGGDLATGFVGASVTQYHKSWSRDGLYTDAALTKAAAATMHVDTTFNATTTGQTYGQPLFIDGGPGGKDLLLVGTEENELTAFDASNGSVVWRKDKTALGNPANYPDLPCGNIMPHQGIHGTGVVDIPSRTVFFDAFVENAAAASPFKHLIYALSIDDGSKRANWPIDVSATFPTFQSGPQGARGGLIIVNGMLYVPYGGLYGDCGTYHGYVVQAPLANPGAATEWHTRSPEGGIWAPAGLASDGTSVFAATGNSPGGTPYGDQESIVRLSAGPMVADSFTPTDWMTTLDPGDIDLGGTGPVLIDGPAGQRWAVALGKNGFAYLLNRNSLGGISSALVQTHVSSSEIINGAAAYTTAMGTYVVFKGTGTNCPVGQSGNLVALQIVTTPSLQFSFAWCADQAGNGSPMVTTTDGRANAVVWAVGAEGDNRLHGFDGDTGAVVFNGGGAGDVLNTVQRFVTPIAAKGRIFVVGDNKAYAFKP